MMSMKPLAACKGVWSVEGTGVVGGGEVMYIPE